MGHCPLMAYHNDDHYHMNNGKEEEANGLVW